MFAGQAVFERISARLATRVGTGLVVMAEIGVDLPTGFPKPLTDELVDAEHVLLHAVPKLTAVLVHADPASATGGPDLHGALAHQLTA